MYFQVESFYPGVVALAHLFSQHLVVEEVQQSGASPGDTVNPWVGAGEGGQKGFLSQFSARNSQSSVDHTSLPFSRNSSQSFLPTCPTPSCLLYWGTMSHTDAPVVTPWPGGGYTVSSFLPTFETNWHSVRSQAADWLLGLSSLNWPGFSLLPL